jgi:hypothetical protein
VLKLSGGIIDSIAELCGDLWGDVSSLVKDSRIQWPILRPWFNESLQFCTHIQNVTEHPNSTPAKLHMQVLIANNPGVLGPERKFDISDYEAYQTMINTSPPSEARLEDIIRFQVLVSRMQSKAEWFHAATSRVAAGRRFCFTASGRVGQVPVDSQIGDRICIFLGAKVPFVVRKVNPGDYVLVGECYIHGLMSGEAFDQASIEVQDIKLV